jgi:hypothetical protein
MDGGSLSTPKRGPYSSNMVNFVWRRENTVYVSGWTKTVQGPRLPERRVAEGEQPTVASTSNTLYVAWLTKRNGPLMLQTQTGDKVETKVISEHADDPVLFSDDENNVGLVWNDADGPKAMILSPTRKIYQTGAEQNRPVIF